MNREDITDEELTMLAALGSFAVRESAAITYAKEHIVHREFSSGLVEHVLASVVGPSPVARVICLTCLADVEITTANIDATIATINSPHDYLLGVVNTIRKIDPNLP